MNNIQAADANKGRENAAAPANLKDASMTPARPKPAPGLPVLMNLYTAQQQTVPKIGSLVQAFIDGKFKPECGELNVQINTSSHDTGHGMDYLNQLLVKKGATPIYDSGMLKWRNGLPGGYDSPADCFSSAGLLAIEERIYLGIRNGVKKISIYEIQNGTLELRQTCDLDAVERISAQNAIAVDNLDALAKHFGQGLNSYWEMGGKFESDWGQGALVYHNGHPTDVVWDFIQVLAIHNGKAYVSNRIYTGLEWHGKFTDSTVIEKLITGAHFKVTLSSGYHKWPQGHPRTLEFNLVFE